jgi:hypothetical protein
LGVSVTDAELLEDQLQIAELELLAFCKKLKVLSVNTDELSLQERLDVLQQVLDESEAFNDAVEKVQKLGDQLDAMRICRGRLD